MIFGILAAAAALALERITYVVVWRQPSAFDAFCRRAALGEPVDVLRWSFYGFKLLQAGVFLAWFAWQGRWFTAPPEAWISNDPRAIVFGLAAIAVGQLFNFAVFFRLGNVGVFYGARFGLEVPWVTGFPFSLLAHPQYVGATLTIWGLFAVVRFPQADWIALPLLETVYYFLGAQLETDRPQESSGSSFSPRTNR